MKTANVLHALTKQPLNTKDVFLFDEPRSTGHELCNYSILESIKDGTAVSSKYSNNVVVVFSNHMPNTRQLSKDRWKIFWIVNAGLKDTTIQLWKNQHGNKRNTTIQVWKNQHGNKRNTTIQVWKTDMEIKHSKAI